MKIVRSYSKSEEAYLDSALLCSHGLDATVVDERAYGGNALGVSVGSIRVEVPDDQWDEADQILRAEVHPPSNSGAKTTPSPSSKGLASLLKGILLIDTGTTLAAAFLGGFWQKVPPPEVTDYLAALSFSDVLWRLAVLSWWPIVILSVFSNLLCLRYDRSGRTLFTVTTIWWILMMLGPPRLMGPIEAFVESSVTALLGVALALMYWSPLSGKFGASSNT